MRKPARSVDRLTQKDDPGPEARSPPVSQRFPETAMGGTP